VSQENVEKTRRAYEAFNRGDLAAVVADFAPEFEYVITGTVPGETRASRGSEEYRRLVHSVWSAFDSLNLHERVIRELAALDPRNGVSIFSADLKLLAERPQAPDGGYYLVVLDADG
jgi:ketosteroid isomerase-like protein